MTAQHEVATPPARIVGGPEYLFGGKVTAGPDGARHGSMASGPWMHGPDGAPSGAALGVLIDDTLGIAAAALRPETLWAVTTELSVDYVAPPPCDGRRITSRGEVVSSHSLGALATGTIQDDTARTLAVMTLRSRYVPGVPEVFHTSETDPPPEPLFPEEPERTSLPELLGASFTADDRSATLRVPGDPLLTNASGVLHGGIALCASQFVASHWFPAGMLLSSVRIAYLRQLEITGDIGFVARVVHGGRTFRLVEVVSYGPSGKPCTTATVAGYTVDETP